MFKVAILVIFISVLMIDTGIALSKCGKEPFDAVLRGAMVLMFVYLLDNPF